MKIEVRFEPSSLGRIRTKVVDREVESEHQTYLLSPGSEGTIKQAHDRFNEFRGEIVKKFVKEEPELAQKIMSTGSRIGLKLIGALAVGVIVGFLVCVLIQQL